MKKLSFLLLGAILVIGIYVPKKIYAEPCSDAGTCFGEKQCYKGQCVSCTLKEHCADGQNCTKDGRCVDCSEDRHCSKGQKCSKEQCVECIKDSNCTGGKKCSNGECIVPEPTWRWYKPDGESTWKEAQKTCSALGVDGKGRLPTTTELRELTKADKETPCYWISEVPKGYHREYDSFSKCAEGERDKAFAYCYIYSR